MSSDPLLLERRGEHLALLTFNRPQVLNALDHATLQAFHRLLGEIERDRDLRAVVLTGAGRAFSAGADLKEMKDSPPGETPVRDAHMQLHLFQDITRRMVNHRCVFVAALNGIAVGIGAELSLAADVRIGCPATELMLSEVTRSLFETNGSMYHLPRVVGQGRAAQWLLTGERVKAEALLAAGFITELVPADRLLPRALELAGTIAGNAPLPVGLSKRLLQRTWGGEPQA